MSDQEKKELEADAIEATEMEDADLEEVSGGGDTNCGCIVQTKPTE